MKIFHKTLMRNSCFFAKNKLIANNYRVGLIKKILMRDYDNNSSNSINNVG